MQLAIWWSTNSETQYPTNTHFEKRGLVTTYAVSICLTGISKSNENHVNPTWTPPMFSWGCVDQLRLSLVTRASGHKYCTDVKSETKLTSRKGTTVMQVSHVTRSWKLLILTHASILQPLQSMSSQQKAWHPPALSAKGLAEIDDVKAAATARRNAEENQIVCEDIKWTWMVSRTIPCFNTLNDILHDLEKTRNWSTV